MIVTILVPFTQFGLPFLFRYCARARDQKKWCCPAKYPDKTQCKTIDAYKALYEGP